MEQPLEKPKRKEKKQSKQNGIVPVQLEHVTETQNNIETETESEPCPPKIDVPTISSTKNELATILESNRTLITKLKLEELKSIVEQPKSSVETFNIRPYTESQLAAFYTNNELQIIDNFVEQYIEAELRGLAIKKHPLYEFLLRYLCVREKITGNNLELDQLRSEYKDLQGQLWSLESVKVTGRGKCHDGILVTASHSFDKATFHRSVYQSIVRILGKVQECVYEHHVLYSHAAEDLKSQIEIHLQTIISNCLNATKLNKNGEVTLYQQEGPPDWKPHLSELRLCISILFAFQRKQVKETQFIKETRSWLSRLVALLLRLSSYQDHLFLLCHVLRCPPGVGAWASGFIQMPLSLDVESPFLSLEINHILTVLSVILSPIRERDKFLEEIAQTKDVAQEALWVMVDSDGEEDEESSGAPLRENDLVAFLNQIPLERLFRAVLLVKQNDFKDHYDDDSITEHHILRFLSFSTTVLQIVNRGLQTYNQVRYNQFCKRLSRFIRHVVQYVTDQWERFSKVQNLEDAAMLKRLQVEYDSFFLRAVYYLYSSQKLGAWQFLAVVPYGLVSINTLWKIFYFLHDSDVCAKKLLTPSNVEDFNVKMKELQLKAQFVDKLSELTDAEVYYLLNTFTNMALARDEIDFVETATMDLLQIGFVNKCTQEICSKTARILLTHLTSKHPKLLSNILKEVRNNITQISDLCLYLYEELPLTVWKLSETDFGILSRILTTTTTSALESKLARMIVSRLNWGFKEDGSLFLPHDLHVKMAMVAAQAVDQDLNYQHWAWQTILRLKLHVSDSGVRDMRNIPDIERCDVILRGVREKKALHSFIALLMTSWGHLIPLICSNGLGQLLFLQSQHKHEAVLFALYLIMPLFLNSQECIINCLEFQEVLSNLLKVDQSYISMAKALVGNPSSTVLQQFGNMIDTQMVNYQSYNLSSPKLLVRLWMNSLVSMGNWSRDYGVLYLLDVIVKAAFFHSDATETVNEVLKELLQAATPQEGSKSGSILKWFTNSNQNVMLVSSSLSPFPWLAYALISVEHEERERKTGFWRELLLQLKDQKGKVNVDLAIKKATQSVDVATFSSTSLCIYRFAQQALDIRVDHPLVVLLWQKFFELYLERLPVCGNTDKGCVGEKFFEGLINFGFRKRIKRKLQETVQFYQSQIDDAEEKTAKEKVFLESCLKVFSAYELWLEEPRLQESNLLLPNLPPQYGSNLLLLIIQGDSDPWYEYVDYEKVKNEQRECVRLWKISNFREITNINKPLPNPGGTMESDDPIERIFRRLKSYDAPKGAPAIEIGAPVIPYVDVTDLNTMLATLKPCFKNLEQFAHNHVMKVSEQKALNCSYQELVPQLYRSVLVKIRKNIPCKGVDQSIRCSGTAVIDLQTEEAKINERIHLQIESNRQAYEFLIANSLQPPSLSLCTSTVCIQHTVRILQQQMAVQPQTARFGVELFYLILPMLNEETKAYLPTRMLFMTCLDQLGQSHICGVELEMPRLLDKILKDPSLGEYLAPHFAPGNVGTSNLLYMYEAISKEIAQKYEVAFDLLSKFDVDCWLAKKTPKLNQRSKFIRLIVDGLSRLGDDPPLEAYTLHGLYRKHLIVVFEHQFPEHYGEILVDLLRTNGETPLAVSVWMDVFNSLAAPGHMHLRVPLREQLRSFAQNQRKLNYGELLETTQLLGNHFTQERLQFGLYGLYPKYKSYLDVYAMLLGMTGHALIVSSLNAHQGLMSDMICQKIWPYLRDMFAPWIAPYSIQNLKDNVPDWIQQLTDDRSVLLPWITTDVIVAQKMLNSFRECVLFLLHMLPACVVILNYIWQWYVVTFAHASVKDHVLNSIHQTLMILPWQNFCPSLSDLEVMLKVLDQYLPECHQFLGFIFVSVSWSNWIQSFSNCSLEIKGVISRCFINMLVKLSNEPNIRSKYMEHFKSLVVQAESLDWRSLDPNSFQQVMDWYIMSCDSNVLFKSDPSDLDYRVLHFLRTASCYDDVIDGNISPEVLTKRYIYLRSYVKLMSVFTSRHKLSVLARETAIASTINCEINHLEKVVKTKEEIKILLQEFLAVLNINHIGHIALKCVKQWTEKKQGDDLIVSTLLEIAPGTICNYEYLAVLYETTLTIYFQNVNDQHEPSWHKLIDNCKLNSANPIEMERAFITNGSILTLNVILLQKSSKCNDYNMLLSQCLDWLENLKTSEQTEIKLPLIWMEFLKSSLKYCEMDESAAGLLLHKFAQLLLQMSDSKGNGGWGRGFLNAIGISKSDSGSLPFKFLCRALGGYILAQLPDMKGEPQVVRRRPNGPSRVGQPGGNTECVKVLMKLDFGQSQGKVKECAELALKQIQDSNNSLHNVVDFLILLTKQFYNRTYFKDLH